MSLQRAPVLVHGATGFTGKLVCEALRRRGVRFDISGRNEAKLVAMASAFGGDVKVDVVDLNESLSVDRAVGDRAIVCACAGPFREIGMPILAACARLGVHYADTTGEQAFVRDALDRHGEVAATTGACIVPAMGYEIALADWGAELATEQLGAPPEEIALLYGVTGDDRRLFATTRGTKRSALRMMGETGYQWVGGQWVAERAGHTLRAFEWAPGEQVTGVSFPSPDSVLIPSHTGARSVRTFIAVNSALARTLWATRAAMPLFARVARPLLERIIQRTAVEPHEDARTNVRFQVRSEAVRKGGCASVTMRGHDPYGLTGELIAYAASRCVAGSIAARGVVAPSIAFPASAALDALRAIGVSVERSWSS